jgi:hypothetical protein
MSPAGIYIQIGPASIRNWLSSATAPGSSTFSSTACAGWHTERLIHKLLPGNDAQRSEQQRLRGEFWAYYTALKDYRQAPTPEKVKALDAGFEALFGQRTGWVTLDRFLRRIRRRKKGLLLVLARPEVPLHTNASEKGRQCRDTFASLKKTCRKLGVSFWAYLNDRIISAGQIPPLSDLIHQRAA